MPDKEKFLDIVRPQTINREILKEMKDKRLTKPFFNKRNALIIFSIIIIGSLFFYFQAEHKAEIKIWQTSENLSLEQETILRKGAYFDFEELTLPVYVLEIQREDSQNFSASLVTQEEKAEGIVRVYNLFSTAPLTLVAQTRFLSDGGKLFRTPERIVIPGKRMERGKWVPGTLDIKVRAIQPGENYNIPPAKFSLPGLAGTALFALVYGESFNPMSGGFSGKRYQVLAQDIEAAEKALFEAVRRTNIRDLRLKAVRQGKVILEEIFSYQIVTKASSEKPGTFVQEFKFNINLKDQVFALKQEDLKKFAQKAINVQLPEDKFFWPESLNLDWQVKEIDWEEGTAILLLNISVKISDRIEKYGLLESIAGQPIDQASLFLKNQFKKAEIEISPFWLNRIPENYEKIKLEFFLD